MNKTPSQLFDDEIRERVFNQRKERLQSLNSINQEAPKEEQNYKEIAGFIRNHVITVGKEQAVKDLQCGLNFLHKDLKEALKEDGKFGEKTFRAFYEVFKHYDIEVVKNAIRKGSLSNVVIGTTSDKNADTKCLVDKVQMNLGGIN